MTEQSNRPVDRGGKVGTVIAHSGKDTIKVQVSTLVKHPIYGKYLRRRRSFAVHDPKAEGKIGDYVEIIPCRRISKTKQFRLSRVIRPAKVAE
ncbi:MAG: 30S ribosomal protein S17 [Phycisphaerae bacterium]